MKKRIAGLILLLSTSLAHGDSDPELKKFLHVPQSISEYGIYPDLQKEKIENENLEGELAKADGYYQKKGYMWGYRIDLNGDGVREYLITSSMGGSGGPHYFIFQKENSAWSIIGDLQGWFLTIPSEDAWLDLIAFGRGGGGHYSRSHLQFRQEEYRTVEIQHFDNGKITTTDTLTPASKNPHIKSE